jgi:hypothetical protein
MYTLEWYTALSLDLSRANSCRSRHSGTGSRLVDPRATLCDWTTTATSSVSGRGPYSHIYNILHFSA